MAKLRIEMEMPEQDGFQVQGTVAAQGSAEAVAFLLAVSVNQMLDKLEVTPTGFAALLYPASAMPRSDSVVELDAGAIRSAVDGPETDP